MRTGKGSDFEREMSRYLSRWISGGARDDLFWRTSTSGGRATVARKKGKSVEFASSDISAVHPEGFPLVEVFSVECKFYADLHFGDLMWKAKSSNFITFWEQVRRDSYAVRRHPMLIMKQNRRPAVVAITRRLCTLLKGAGVCLPHHALIVTKEDMQLMLMEEFFTDFRPMHLAEVQKYGYPALPPPSDGAGGSSSHSSPRRRVPLAGV